LVSSHLPSSESFPVRSAFGVLGPISSVPSYSIPSSILHLHASTVFIMPRLVDINQTSHYLDKLNPFQISNLKTMDAVRDLSFVRLCLAVFASWLFFAVARTLITAYRTPLADVPGPWIAKFTRFWLMRGINTRKWDKININLHRKYGES